MQIAYFQSTATLTVTLTTVAGEAVTGATVTLTLLDEDGTAVVEDASVTETGGGEYTYTIADDLLDTRNHVYVAQITATSGSVQRYTEIPIRTAVDVD